MKSIIHIDCNSFFASCEIATHEGCEDKPVIVANVNETGGGIILALNKRAKKVGLRRGNPMFQVKTLIEKHNVVVFPVDHEKYHRISQQIMQTVIEQDLVIDFVQYSVDEFFGALPLEDPKELRFYIQKVKDAIEQNTKIPVSCGCSQTYTLAKVATYFAKRYEGYKGICVLTQEKRKNALSRIHISEVWGIGRAHQKKLAFYGELSAFDFMNFAENFVAKMLGTSGLNTWKELNGIPAVKMERNGQQKSIMQSRTFAYMVTEKKELQSYIESFVSICCEKLREQKSVCSNIIVFINTNRHRDDLPQYSNDVCVRLEKPTADTLLITKFAYQGLDAIFKQGYQYKRAGVVLTNITDSTSVQLDLFTYTNDEKKRNLMKNIDAINSKYGKNMIHLAVHQKK
jgi:DNA polymerase V